MESVSIIDIYEEVLSGRRKRFPLGTWNYLSDAIRLVKYLIEDKLQWSREDVCNNLRYETFVNAKLAGMMVLCFNKSPYQALNAAYPEKYKPWELQHTLQGFWTRENGVEAVRWLLEEKLKWSREDICSYLDFDTFVEHGIQSVLRSCFDNSLIVALDSVYLGDIKAWELKRVAKGFWSEKTTTDAIRWMIEEKLKWSRKDVCKKLTRTTFLESGLSGMLASHFNNSPYDAINMAYPNQYKPWELNNAPKSFWTPETALQATQWLIEEKLNWTEEYAKSNITFDLFKQYGLGGMLQACFNDSPRKAILATYPE